jgi:hypothetical protein
MPLASDLVEGFGIQIPRFHQLRRNPWALRLQKRFVTYKLVVCRYQLQIDRSETGFPHEQRQLPSNAGISTIRPPRPSIGVVEIAQSWTLRPRPLMQIEVVV